MKSPILGQSYVARSINASNDELINLYAEPTPSNGKTAGFFNRCPGLELKVSLGSSTTRGAWSLKGKLYIVAGSSVYEILSNYSSRVIGSVTGAGPVSIADNGFQIFFACNPSGFIYNTTTGVFQQITDPDFPGAGSVGYLDGYFVFNEPNSQKIWITSILDGTNIDALDFSSADGSPDSIVAIVVDHREVWIYGQNSVEVWYDAGLADFPLTRIQGAFNEVGCLAPYSVARLDNGIFWLGSDARGFGTVYRTNGYAASPVSTSAVDYDIQSLENLSEAVAFTYQQDGHLFYVLSFPSSNRCWVYDVLTSNWHKRYSFSSGEFTRYFPVCQAVFGQDIIVGSGVDGSVYKLNLDVFSDNGGTQKWLRRWRALPSGTNDLKRTAQHSLQIDMESGVGLVTGQGINPVIMLRWSDDAGHTWSNYTQGSIGNIGDFGLRVNWHRLGMTSKLRDRVYEISGTDPVKISIMGAELVLGGTNA